MSREIKIFPLTDQDKQWTADHLRKQWGDTVGVTRGKIWDLTQNPGFAAWLEGQVVGLLTYHISGESCEVTSLDSQMEGIGVGTSLIEAAKGAAKMAGCKRLWLITTNDNTHALRFYQKSGFHISAIHVEAIDKVTRVLKPGIPLLGRDDIPIRDEIELEMDIV